MIRNVKSRVSKYILVLTAVFLTLSIHGTCARASRLDLIGKPAPEFTLNDSSGKAISLATGKGNPILLVFLSDKSPVMIENSVKLLSDCKSLEKTFADQKLQVITVKVSASGDPSERLIKATDTAGFNLLPDLDNSVYSLYGLYIVPTAVVIDPEFNVREMIGYTSRITSKITTSVETMLGLRSSTVDAPPDTPNPEAKAIKRNYKLAVRLFEKSRYEKAMEKLDTIIGTDPTHEKARLLKAKIYIMQSEWDKALALAGDVLKIHPDNRYSRLISAQAYHGLNQNADALEMIEEIRGSDRIRAEALALEGKIYQEQNKLDEAVKSLSQATEIFSEKQVIP